MPFSPYRHFETLSKLLWTLLLFAKDSNDNQQIACQAEQGRYDCSAGRENCRIESVFSASRAGHQDVAHDNEDACDYHNVSTGHVDGTKAVSPVDIGRCGVHIV